MRRATSAPTRRSRARPRRRAPRRRPGWSPPTRFDEASGTTAADASGNANTGSLQTGAGWTAAGHAGGGLVLRRRERPGARAGLELARPDLRDDPRGLDPAGGRPGRLADDHAARDRRLLPEREQRHGRAASVGRRHVRADGRLRDRPDAQPGRAWTHRRPDLRRGDPAPVRQRHAVASSAARTGTIQASANPLWIGGNSPYGEYFAGASTTPASTTGPSAAAEIATDMATPVGGGHRFDGTCRPILIAARSRS